MDLAVSCALLLCHGIVPEGSLDDTLLWAELGLDGTLRPVAGTLAVADCARKAGCTTIVVAKENSGEANLIPGLDVLAVSGLPELVSHLRGERPIKRGVSPSVELVPETGVHSDMADVRGLSVARLALEVMVAGGHNLLFHGPPGVGKTMLARRACGLFPTLDREAALEITKIHDVARRRMCGRLLQNAPLRSPHHTVSAAGLLGGGSPPRPGEVSLAHRGLLFLDELPEFPRACIEGLREPLEDGEVSIVRAGYACRFPARFQLMAAMNPCPCGYLGHPERACICSLSSIQRYQKKVSGPFMDRMDLVVPVTPVDPKTLGGQQQGESSAVIRARIVRARDRQERRLVGTPWRTNAEISAGNEAMQRLCPLTEKAAKMLESLTRSRALSPRAQHRLRRVALTLKDLREVGDVNSRVEARFVAEAAHLRRLPDVGVG